MEILKTIGKRLLRAIAAIFLSVVMVVAVALGLPFIIVGMILVAIFAPDDWYTNLSIDGDPNLDIDN